MARSTPCASGARTCASPGARAARGTPPAAVRPPSRTAGRFSEAASASLAGTGPRTTSSALDGAQSRRLPRRGRGAGSRGSEPEVEGERVEEGLERRAGAPRAAGRVEPARVRSRGADQRAHGRLRSRGRRSRDRPGRHSRGDLLDRALRRRVDRGHPRARPPPRVGGEVGEAGGPEGERGRERFGEGGPERRPLVRHAPEHAVPPPARALGVPRPGRSGSGRGGPRRAAPPPPRQVPRALPEPGLGRGADAPEVPAEGHEVQVAGEQERPAVAPLQLERAEGLDRLPGERPRLGHQPGERIASVERPGRAPRREVRHAARRAPRPGPRRRGPRSGGPRRRRGRSPGAGGGPRARRGADVLPRRETGPHRGPVRGEDHRRAAVALEGLLGEGERGSRIRNAPSKSTGERARRRARRASRRPAGPDAFPPASRPGRTGNQVEGRGAGKGSGSSSAERESGAHRATSTVRPPPLRARSSGA